MSVPDTSDAESKTPLPKPGRHVPSLDMPCGLLGISGTKTRSPKIGWVRAESAKSEDSPARKLIALNFGRFVAGAQNDSRWLIARLFFLANQSGVTG